MKASYTLPSGTYSLILSKEDLRILIDTGRLCCCKMAYDIPCTTSRTVYNPKTKTLDVLDKKEVFNDLRFFLDAPVADLSGGVRGVQFLNIYLEKENDKWMLLIV